MAGTLPWLIKPRLLLSLPTPARRSLRPLAALHDVARKLRAAPRQPSGRLDIARTIRAAAHEAGYLRPVYEMRRQSLGLTVLIAEGSRAEHEPRRAGLWWQALGEAGIEVEVFHYSASPEWVWPMGKDRTEALALRDLATARRRSRLVLVTRGDEFSMPQGGSVPREVLEILGDWGDCVIQTPVAAAQWGGREALLAQRTGVLIMPYGVSGPRDLAGILRPESGAQGRGPWLREAPFPTSGGGSGRLTWLQAEAARWRKPSPGISQPAALRLDPSEAAASQPPEDASLAELLGALESHLGPEGMLWLRACASYPILRFPLTAWIGSQIGTALGWDEDLRADLLARLCRLAWFEAGLMPLWLRKVLREGLAPEEQRLVLEIFRRFYGAWDPGAPGAQDAETAELWQLRAEYDPNLRERLKGLTTEDAIRAPRKANPAEALDRARRQIIADRGMVLLGATAASLELWRAWPDRNALPLPPGAWLHVMAVGGFALAAGLAVYLAHRRKGET